jgi:hypothetical protein
MFSVIPIGRIGEVPNYPTNDIEGQDGECDLTPQMEGAPFVVRD